MYKDKLGKIMVYPTTVWRNSQTDNCQGLFYKSTRCFINIQVSDIFRYATNGMLCVFVNTQM